MNGAVLTTTDPGITTAVRELAIRAGLPLSVHQPHEPTAARRKTATLIIVGADQITALGEQTASPDRTIIVAAGTSPVTASQAAAGQPVLRLPQDEKQIVRLFEDTAAPVLDRLRATGCRIGFTDLRHRRSGYVPPLAVTDWRRHPGQAVYVNCGQLACGDADIGLAHMVRRSNFRSLHRRFPAAWTDTVADDLTELGAFVADLPAAAIDALCSLADRETILDTDDHRAVHADDIVESWALEAAFDVYSRLPPACRKVWDRTCPYRVTELLHQVVDDTGVGPVHDGWQVRWPITELAPLLAARLMAEHRHTPPGTPSAITALQDHAARHRYRRASRPSH
ncbi:hypothetical protein [Actinoplanes philippinensis]|uniref:hypothetical protein n=1 Tax=Actinoplanes philippinensis TaxID=35752 RepID=UPI0033D36F7A